MQDDKNTAPVRGENISGTSTMRPGPLTTPSGLRFEANGEGDGLRVYAVKGGCDITIPLTEWSQVEGHFATLLSRNAVEGTAGYSKR